MAGLTNYLCTERKRHSLRQKDVARLLGISRPTVGRYEADQRPVSALLIVAGEVIYGKRAAELFPAFYRTTQEAIGAEALALLEELEGLEDEESIKRRKLLAGIPGRTTAFDA